MFASLAAKLMTGDLDFVVTGGGGWLGRTTLAVLADLLGNDFERRVSVFGRGERLLAIGPGRSILSRRMEAMAELSCRPAVFLHYAFLTKERAGEMSVEDFVSGNTAISETVCAAARRLKPHAIFVPSSGAVYCPDRALDTDLEANPYGVMKVSQEARFAELAQDIGCRLIVARVFNIAGPYINKLDSYALASIIANVLRGGPIVLRANHPVIRSYVHAEDLVMVALASLLDASAPNEAPFDTAGECEIEVGELALRTAKVLGHPDMPIERPVMRPTPVNRYVGDGLALRKLFDRHFVTPRSLDQQILDTADFLAQTIR